MRRSLGLVLVVLGAFLATLAPLIRFYVSSQVIQAPLNRYERVRLEAANASVFDMATLKVRKGMTLVADTTIRGDVKANGGNGRIAVWDSSTTITDKSTGKQIDLQAFRMAFDRRTAQLVNCCAANVGGDVNVKMFGYGLLYPIADVHRRDYPFYDTTTRRTLPMKYTGDEELNGIDTYKFVQQVPLAKVETMDVKLPGDMLGLGKNAYPQHVDRYFEAVNTQWVDPRTGIPVKHEQKITQSLRTRDGTGKLIVADADMITVPADQKALAKLSNDSAMEIAWTRIYGPVLALVAGLGMLGAGSAITLLNGRRLPPPPPAPRGPDGRFGGLATGPPPGVRRRSHPPAGSARARRQPRRLGRD
ncbi:DUF3068 domain-containing protein [Actinomadura rupiterrae]|uniref:DUF3068 domain-containing protein n=1 Tax=Actinomadura rupiterrae TaxID=559627 RepID=UPI0020A412D4|nr:DUF3068 domain-containing protein [Actinomadura rupiterrae]MCP2335137.1 hypothetical protein [Actinomadura rupiterrae]